MNAGTFCTRLTKYAASTIAIAAIGFIAVQAWDNPQNSPTQADNTETIPTIRIEPDGLESLQQKLDAYTTKANTSYEPSVHSALALDVAAIQMQQGDYHLADRTLRRALRHIKDTQPDAVISLTTLHNARADIAISDGEMDDARYQLHRAVNILEKHVPAEHPLLVQYNFRLAMLHWGQSRAEDNFHALRRARTIMAKIRDNEKIAQPTRDMAGLVFLASRIDSSRGKSSKRFLTDVDAYITRLSAQQNPSQEISDALLFAHLLKMRIYEYTGEQDQASALLTQISALRGENASELLVQITNPTAVLMEIKSEQSSAIAQAAGEGSITAGTPGFSDATELFGSLVGGLDTNASVIPGWNTSDTRLIYLSQIAGNYVDAQFCVTADGRVTDFKVIDSHGSKNWVQRMEDYVVQRRYLPEKIADQSKGCNFHYERFTVTSKRTKDTSVTGSRIVGRQKSTYVARINLLETDMFQDELLRKITDQTQVAVK